VAVAEGVAVGIVVGDGEGVAVSVEVGVFVGVVVGVLVGGTAVLVNVGVLVGVFVQVGVGGSNSSPLTLDTVVSLGNDRVEANTNPARANSRRTRPTKRSVRVGIYSSFPGK
jgi:hypothetical protein